MNGSSSTKWTSVLFFLKSGCRTCVGLFLRSLLCSTGLPILMSVKEQTLGEVYLAIIMCVCRGVSWPCRAVKTHTLWLFRSTRPALSLKTTPAISPSPLHSGFSLPVILAPVPYLVCIAYSFQWAQLCI